MVIVKHRFERISQWEIHCNVSLIERFSQTSIHWRSGIYLLRSDYQYWCQCQYQYQYWETQCIALSRYPDPFHSRLCRLGQQDCQIVGVCAKPQCASSAKSSSLVERQHKTTYLAKRLFTGCSHCKRTETYTGLVGLCWDGGGGSRIKFPFNRRFRTFAHLQPFSLFPAILPSPSLY